MAEYFSGPGTIILKVNFLCFNGTRKPLLIHGFSPVNARLLSVYGIAFYAIMLINTCCWGRDHKILMHDGEAGVHFIRITTNVLISDNLPVRKSYFDSNIIARISRHFFYGLF